MKIPDPNLDLEADDALSFRDFTGWIFTHRPDVDFAGKVIYASCFSQEKPDTVVFPPTLTGATFVRCNLSNVVIPAGNTVIDCNTMRYRVQNDRRDWQLGALDLPVKVLGEKYWLQQGTSVDPADIPLTPLVLAPNEDLVTKLREIQAAKEVG